MNLANANDFWKLRRLVGPAVRLLILLAAYTPADWTGDAAEYAASGNVIGRSRTRGSFAGYTWNHREMASPTAKGGTARRARKAGHWTGFHHQRSE